MRRFAGNDPDAWKLPLGARRWGVPLRLLLWVKIWRVADPKMIFAKNQERVLLCPIVQIHPGSSEIDRICTKFKKCLGRSARRNKSSYAYLRRSNIYMLSCLQLSIGRFGSCLIKKHDFSTPKMENTLFVGRNGKRPLWRSSPSQGAHTSPIWARSNKLYHSEARN
jgi:hypothetical protein